MNAREAQKRLKLLFSKRFGQSNVKSEWRSNAEAADWLNFGDIYAPRPDVAVGPFNIEEGRNTSEIEDLFSQHRNCFDRLRIADSSLNLNQR